MPAGVPSPENDPLVAARPVISIGMTDYDVIPISDITTSSGGEKSTEFTNETTNTDEVGGSVEVGAELNPFKLASASVTASYSHTWARTASTTSSFGTNWSNTRSTNPSEAARLKLRIFIKNLGSATALDVKPTFSLVLGNRTIATITPQELADRLAPKGLPKSRYPETGTIVIERDNQNNYIILSLEELKAIQMGAPLELVVTQVSADVARWNPATQSYDSREAWSSFEGEIDPVVVTLKANLGDNKIYNYQVYVGTDFYNLGYTFRDVLARVFSLGRSQGKTYIEGRPYPDDWYVASPSDSVLQAWNTAGRPENILNLKMFRNTTISLMSPGANSAPKIDLATFGPDFKKVYVSAFPNNFPILSVKAQVTIDGQMQEIELQQNDQSFYINGTPFSEPANPSGKVFVENARGDVSETDIILPALYTSAADVEASSSFLPQPGDEYLLFSRGDPNKPIKLYCLFFDPKTGNKLDIPREYLSLPASSDSANFLDWIQDTYYRRVYFSKVRINPDNFKLAPQDTTFTRREYLGSERPSLFPDEALFFGSIRLWGAHLDTAYANLDLTGTPLSLDPYTEFSQGEWGTVDQTYVDESRQVETVMATQPPDYSLDSQGYIGLKPDSVSLVYHRDFFSGTRGTVLPGKALEFNLSSSGSPGYADMGASASLAVSDAVTLEAWIQPEPHGRDINETAAFINKEGEYELLRFPDGTIRWALAVDSPRWKSINTHYRAREDEWVHVALVYDMNDAQPSVKTYINGNLFQASPASGAITDFYGDPAQDRLEIGNRQSSDAQYAGRVDEVRIWNIARTVDQIRATIADTLPPAVYNSAESGLIGYWRFDALEDLGVGNDGSDDVRDYSPNGNHGDLSGDALPADPVTGLPGIKPVLSRSFELQQNYPNPFNPSTTITYRLPTAQRVTLTVYDLLGRTVAALVNRKQAAGEHAVTFDGRGLASGIYFYRLKTPSFSAVHKMALMR
ncbi:MAG: T9SS type A sorting domain-containing protein [Calditrichia bacterium]